jgi:hypothetical protein
MANVLENVGERTIEHLDYVGSLNIQLWATLWAMRRALPFVGNRYRCYAHGFFDGDLHGIHSRDARSL